jgi:hypothetical protein
MDVKAMFFGILIAILNGCSSNGDPINALFGQDHLVDSEERAQQQINRLEQEKKAEKKRIRETFDQMDREREHYFDKY